ncbi:hypothetical protein [Persephonella sp.]
MEQEKQEVQQEQSEKKKLRFDLKELNPKKAGILVVAVAVAGLIGFRLYNTFIAQESQPPIGTQTAVVQQPPRTVAAGAGAVNQSQQKQQARAVQAAKPVAAVSPRPAAVSAVSKVKEEKKTEEKDIFLGKDLEIVKLEKQKEILKLKADIAKLRLEIEKKEKELKELEGKSTVSAENPEVENLRRQIESLRMQISSMKKKPRFTGTSPKLETRYVVSAIVCTPQCRAIIHTKQGEFAVSPGSVLPDGAKVKSITKKGVYLQIGDRTFFRPVEMYIPAKVDNEKNIQQTQTQNPRRVQRPVVWRKNQ